MASSCVAKVIESFCLELMPPRLESDEFARKAIARGVKEGGFGHWSGTGRLLRTNSIYGPVLNRAACDSRGNAGSPAGISQCAA